MNDRSYKEASDLGALLIAAGRKLSKLSQVERRERQVTETSWTMLRAMHANPGIQPSHLAAHLDLSRGTVSKLLDELVYRRLIYWDFIDGRARSLTLTVLGQERLAELDALSAKRDEEFFGKLSSSDRESFQLLLQAVMTD